MKKIVLFIITLSVLSTTLLANSEDNYRTRNHKLNKNRYSTPNDDQHQVVAIDKKKINEEANAYLSRNYKFHKHNQTQKAFIRTDKLDPEYQAKNYKLKGKPAVGEGSSKLGKNLVKFFTLFLALGIIMQQ